MDPLEGIKGLGYSGELKGSDLLNQKYGQGATMLKGKKGKGITGQVRYLSIYLYKAMHICNYLINRVTGIWSRSIRR